MEVGEVAVMSWWGREGHEVAGHLDFQEGVMVIVGGQINDWSSRMSRERKLVF